MQRREVLRILATGTALQLAPRSLLAMLTQARKAMVDHAALQTLTPHQEATVKVMAELILPRTDTPGATDVGATQFIDLMLTEWYEDPERSLFLRGLSDVDSRTQALFRKDFVDCSTAEQSDILSVLGQKMIEESPRVRMPVGEGPPHGNNFYSMLRYLTLTAYYTSERGATEELHFEIIPDHYSGCESASSSKEGVQQK